jgi:hypothetical protein
MEIASTFGEKTSHLGGMGTYKIVHDMKIVQQFFQAFPILHGP